jgi:CheY-like chemotaxis protein
MTQQPLTARVLVADDDAMSRELLGVLLEAEGYVVESAETGDAALALLCRKANLPDVILADLQMPGTTGCELADKLRSACGAETLLLAMSGSQPPETAVSRFDGFLLKPFKVREVAAALSARKRRADAATVPSKEKKRKPGSRTSPRTATLVSVYASEPETASKVDMGSQVEEAQSAESFYSAVTWESPVLNDNIYGQLARAMPVQQLHDMYALCVNDARDRIAVMRRLVAEHDRVNFSREAHAIKGSCGMLGATQLHGMASELERSSLEGGGSETAQDVNSLDELSAACDRLQRMLGSRV